MKIPNADRAVVDIRKLRDYCLNPEHRVGKHKARLFESLLGLRIEDAEELRKTLLAAAKTHEAKLGEKDEFGQRYQIIFSLSCNGKTANVLSAWIVPAGKDIPILITCYPV